MLGGFGLTPTSSSASSESSLLRNKEPSQSSRLKDESRSSGTHPLLPFKLFENIRLLANSFGHSNTSQFTENSM